MFLLKIKEKINECIQNDNKDSNEQRWKTLEKYAVVTEGTLCTS